MKLSTKVRYGARALLDLALHSGESPVMLKDIARRQEISLAYLEHIISPFVSAGMVRTIRGARGGLTLARPAPDIKLSEIVQVLDGPIVLVECIANTRACHLSAHCPTRDVWADMKHAIDRTLGGVTLQDLVDRQRAKGQAESDMYQI